MLWLHTSRLILKEGGRLSVICFCACSYGWPKRFDMDKYLGESSRAPRRVLALLRVTVLSPAAFAQALNTLCSPLAQAAHPGLRYSPWASGCFPWDASYVPATHPRLTPSATGSRLKSIILTSPFRPSMPLARFEGYTCHGYGTGTPKLSWCGREQDINTCTAA